jgi:hypothetical protein
MATKAELCAEAALKTWRDYDVSPVFFAYRAAFFYGNTADPYELGETGNDSHGFTAYDGVFLITPHEAATLVVFHDGALIKHILIPSSYDAHAWLVAINRFISDMALRERK